MIRIMQTFHNYPNAVNPKIKFRQKSHYERFGEVIRYLTIDEIKLFFDSIDHYQHKLMFQIISQASHRKSSVSEFF